METGKVLVFGPLEDRTVPELREILRKLSGGKTPEWTKKEDLVAAAEKALVALGAVAQEPAGPPPTVELPGNAVDLLKLAGLDLQAGYRAIGEALKAGPVLPEAAEVFAAYDRGCGGKGDDESVKRGVVAVLEKLGLREKDLAPGRRPFAVRQETTDAGVREEVLVLSLGDGRKPRFVRPARPARA